MDYDRHQMRMVNIENSYFNELAVKPKPIYIYPCTFQYSSQLIINYISQLIIELLIVIDFEL
jgi:hypothetical protein